jgi:GPH family glycoside/pentoside/hexuronide:cation symporter
VVINTISTSVLVYYCSAVIRNEGAVTPVMAAFVLASLLTLPFVGKIHARLGRRKSMMLGAGLILLGQLVFWINRYSLIHMFVYSFLLGISVPLNIVMYATNRADITDIQAYKTGGKRIDSMVHNASGFVEKAANALVIAAIGWVLQFAHYDGNLSVQPESAVKAIVGLLSVGVLIAAVIMLFAASRIRVEEHLKEARESGV